MRAEQEIIAEKLAGYIEQEKDMTEGHGYFTTTLDEMRRQSENTFNRPIASSRGGLAVVFKKVVRRMVAWYANPFAGQQSAFNSAAADSTAYLGKNVKQLQDENALLLERLAKLEAEVWQLRNEKSGE